MRIWSKQTVCNHITTCRHIDCKRKELHAGIPWKLTSFIETHFIHMIPEAHKTHKTQHAHIRFIRLHIHKDISCTQNAFFARPQINPQRSCRRSGRAHESWLWPWHHERTAHSFLKHVFSVCTCMIMRASLIQAWVLMRASLIQAWRQWFPFPQPRTVQVQVSGMHAWFNTHIYIYIFFIFI